MINEFWCREVHTTQPTGCKYAKTGGRKRGPKGDLGVQQMELRNYCV